jgi:hypothetical protein
MTSVHSPMPTPPLNAPQAAYSRRHWLGVACASAMAATWQSVQAQPASAVAEESRAPDLPAVGSPLQVPAIELLGGGTYQPTSSDGQVLVVYWWASTCPFCALQSPSMEALWRQHRARGLQMLALSIDRAPEPASAYLKSRGYTFPSAWASPDWRKRFPKPRGLPITLVRGRDGKLLLAERGQMFAEDVAAIATLL